MKCHVFRRSTHERHSVCGTLAAEFGQSDLFIERILSGLDACGWRRLVVSCWLFYSMMQLEWAGGRSQAVLLLVWLNERRGATTRFFCLLKVGAQSCLEVRLPYVYVLTFIHQICSCVALSCWRIPWAVLQSIDGISMHKNRYLNPCFKMEGQNPFMNLCYERPISAC